MEGQTEDLVVVLLRSRSGQLGGGWGGSDEYSPDLISSAAELSSINLINVNEQFPCSKAGLYAAVWRPTSLLSKLFCIPATFQDVLRLHGTARGLQTSSIVANLKPKSYSALFHDETVSGLHLRPYKNHNSKMIILHTSPKSLRVTWLLRRFRFEDVLCGTFLSTASARVCGSWVIVASAFMNWRFGKSTGEPASNWKQTSIGTKTSSDNNSKRASQNKTSVCHKNWCCRRVQK